ncbi:hypothetical protein [Gordonia sp. CPCC 205333]|uniref:hypothetical protein n=1 Tax=Gordonia sp. CPCC 205333 TaxID=3140790 RepID=UPI003AF3BA6E
MPPRLTQTPILCRRETSNHRGNIDARHRLLAIALLAGCATSKNESVDEQSSAQPSSLQQYLLTAEDFPAGAKFQHPNQGELRKATANNSTATSDDPGCTTRLTEANASATDIDGINAVPRQGILLSALVVKPQYDLAAVARSVVGRCAKQTVTTPGIPVEMTFNHVPNSIPHSYVLRQTVITRDDGSTVPSTLVGYANRRDVTVSLFLIFLPAADTSGSTEANVAEFEKYFARAVAKVGA